MLQNRQTLLEVVQVSVFRNVPAKKEVFRPVSDTNTTLPVMNVVLKSSDQSVDLNTAKDSL